MAGRTKGKWSRRSQDEWRALMARFDSSGLGVEAFVSYNGQSTVAFKVFDWARNDHWQTNIPFSHLGDSLTTESAHGTAYQVLPVWNSPWKIN